MLVMGVLTILGMRLGHFCVLCSISGFSVKVKLSVPLLCVCALSGKAVPSVTYTVSSGTFNRSRKLANEGTCYERPQTVVLVFTTYIHRVLIKTCRFYFLNNFVHDSSF